MASKEKISLAHKDKPLASPPPPSHQKKKSQGKSPQV